MNANHFPPQAYTKDTLHAAYQWLQTQEAEVKRLATTPDLLISLYHKSQLAQGRDPLDRPSLKSFKSDLKSLAGMMGEFESKPEPKVETPRQETRQEIKADYRAEAASNRDPLQMLDPRSRAMIQEVRDSLNLSHDLEALRLLLVLGHKKLDQFLKDR
jgi:hypothetical protein